MVYNQLHLDSNALTIQEYDCLLNFKINHLVGGTIFVVFMSIMSAIPCGILSGPGEFFGLFFIIYSLMNSPTLTWQIAIAVGKSQK